MKKNITDIALLSGVQGINIFIPLIIMPYLVNVLGVEGYGRYSFALAFAIYFNILIDFGFNLSSVQRIAVHSSDLLMRSRLFLSTITAKFLLFIVSSIVFVALIYQVDQINEYKSELTVVYFFILGNTFSTVWYFQAIEKIRTYSLINVFFRLLMIPFLFVYVKNPDDIIKALIIFSSSHILSSLTTLIYLFSKKLLVLAKYNFEDVKKEFKNSFPVFLSTSSMSLYTQLITIYLGVATSDRIVGIYTILVKVSSALYAVFFYPISQVFYPIISKDFSVSKLKGITKFKQIRLYIFIFMLLLTLVYFQFGKYLFYLVKPELVDEKFEIYVKILSVLPLLMSLSATYGQLGILASGDSYGKKMFSRTYIVAGITAIVMGIILIEFYNIGGAIFTIIFTEIIVLSSLFYSFIILKKNLIQN